MDWMSFNWDDEIIKHVAALTEPVDCIVLGRHLAQGFIPHWASVAADPSNPEYEVGKKFNETHKVVFTKTLEKSEWDNTDVASGDLAEEIQKLKNADGGDIIAYGGAAFVSSLIKAGLVDELNLFVNPVALGTGMPIFQSLENYGRFQLESAIPFSCGITVLQYTLPQN